MTEEELRACAHAFIEACYHDEREAIVDKVAKAAKIDARPFQAMLRAAKHTEELRRIFVDLYWKARAVLFPPQLSSLEYFRKCMI
jgi:hypothetical protein